MPPWQVVSDALDLGSARSAAVYQESAMALVDAPPTANPHRDAAEEPTDTSATASARAQAAYAAMPLRLGGADLNHTPEPGR